MPELENEPDEIIRVKMSNDYREARAKAIAEFEKHYVTQILLANSGNVSKASRAAGLDRVYFHRLMRRHNIYGSGRRKPSYEEAEEDT